MLTIYVRFFIFLDNPELLYISITVVALNLNYDDKK